MRHRRRWHQRQRRRHHALITFMQREIEALLRRYEKVPFIEVFGRLPPKAEMITVEIEIK